MTDYCAVLDTKDWLQPAPSWAKLERAESDSLREAELAFAAALAAARIPNAPSRSLANSFREQVEIWERETGYMSSPIQRMEHPSYQAILGMARESEREIVGLLLRDMRDHRRPWFGALSYITKENPISRSDAGKMEKMISAWLQWGKDRHIL